jgi:hypothetical protein
VVGIFGKIFPENNAASSSIPSCSTPARWRVTVSTVRHGVAHLLTSSTHPLQLVPVKLGIGVFHADADWNVACFNTIEMSSITSSKLMVFHDIGLMTSHSGPSDRFEADGANAARAFLRARGIAQQDLDTVWTAIALHTTPGIPPYMHAVVAFVTAGVDMDVLGLNYPLYSGEVRNAVVAEYPRTPKFKEDIIQAFCDAIHKKPETTFGNVKVDVLADKDPKFVRGNFCSVIRSSGWLA